MDNIQTNKEFKYNTFNVIKQFVPEFANSKRVFYGLDWVRGREEIAPYQVADCLCLFLTDLMIEFFQGESACLIQIKNIFLAVEEIANSEVYKYDSEQFCFEFFDWIEQEETDNQEFAFFFRDQLLPSTRLKWEKWNKNNWANRVWKKYFDLEVN